MNFSEYMIEQYKRDIDNYGIKKVWDSIIEYKKSNTTTLPILDTQNYGELYEIGLAHTNKTDKKQQGKYYTPKDIATLLSTFFNTLKGSNICDVCCGTGNLILSFLELIGYSNARDLILNNRLYLYDIDEVALNICKHSICEIYGYDVTDYIHCVQGDFLSKDIQLPSDCKVISNPPYHKIDGINENWCITEVITDSKELYSAFIEKIVKNSNSSVIITPYSFVGSDKFYSLRKVLNNYSGMIFSFDNVPANIFNGKKHGIFNTNSSNSVRASITVVENAPNKKGFRISPLIRFSSTEREKLLTKDTLLSLLSQEYQIVTDNNSKYYKCFTQLYTAYKDWIKNSDSIFGSLLSSTPTNYSLCVPTTCRYYLSATERNLDRAGKYTFYFNSEEDKELAYCILNSSFAYWHWRLYDGGIIYPIGLLSTLPIKSTLTVTEQQQLHDIVNDIKKTETNYLVYAKNSSEIQENVKFPIEFRDKFNEFMVSILGINLSIREFDRVHSNKIFL